MKQGLFRVNDPFLGECAKIKWFAGDASPYLPRDQYEFFQFKPDFDALPDEEAFRAAAHAPPALHFT